MTAFTLNNRQVGYWFILKYECGTTPGWPNYEQKVQECYATEFDSSTPAGYINLLKK